jgi:rare lipoprotein A
LVREKTTHYIMRTCWSFLRRGPWLAAAAALVLSACAETELVTHAAKQIRAVVPEKKAAGVYKLGKPYQVDGVWYYPAVDYDYAATGIASWYGPDFHGRPTANGETFDMNAVSAAHKTLPLPSIVRVTNLESGRSIIVRVNDRGPFAYGRIIDLSRRAAQLLGFERKGTAKVRVEILAAESRTLAFSTARTTEEGAADPAVKAAPRAAVTVEELPAPGAAPGSKLEPQVALRSREWPAVAPAEPVAANPGPPELEAAYEPVRPTTIVIQAGAFLRYENAHRLGAKLSPLGPVTVTPVMVGEQQMFRVRLGPVASVEEGDSLLERLIKAGYTDARMIVVE